MKHIHIARIISICLLLCLIYPSIVYADGLPVTPGLKTDATTGFRLYDDRYHWGNPNLCYEYDESSFASIDPNEFYKIAFEDGMEKWNNTGVISLSSSGSNVVTIKYDGVYNSTYAENRTSIENLTLARSGDWSPDSGNGHQHCQTIFIYEPFYSWGFSGRAGTMAHEIGHVYGLFEAHSASGNVMVQGYEWSTVPSPTSQEIMGMKVVTHQHSHTSTTAFSHQTMNNTYHKRRCLECLTYTEEAHSVLSGWTSLGDQHYHQCNTACGYKTDIGTHSYTTGNYSGNEEQHWQTCNVCGHDSTGENHDFGSRYSSSRHWQECSICEYQLPSVSHSLRYSYNGTANHTKSCSGCYYRVTENHTWRYTQVNAGQHKKNCRYCSHNAITEAHNIVYSGGIYMCNQCGYQENYKKGLKQTQYQPN